jgi:predicted transcriptional regulator
MADNPALQGAQALVTQIVSSYVKKNQVPLTDISTVITVSQSLLSLGKAGEAVPQAPAVPIRQSIRPSYFICLEWARGQMLRKHLRPSYGLNADEYRAKFRRITPSLPRLIQSGDPPSKADWVGAESSAATPTALVKLKAAIDEWIAVSSSCIDR